MDEILQYISMYLPTLIAIITECGIFKLVVKFLKESKESKELKQLLIQNKQLLSELKESKKLNKEYLTKIDKISRGE